DEDDHADDGDRTRADQAVVRDRIRGRAPELVRDDRNQHRPADPPGGVPDEELPPGHPADAGEPGGGDTEDRDEPAEEDGLGAVAAEEALRRRERALEVRTHQRHAAEERTASPAPDPVARVVS